MAAWMACTAIERREVSQCSPTGICPIPAMTTSVMNLPLDHWILLLVFSSVVKNARPGSFPGCGVSDAGSLGGDLASHPRVHGIVDLRAPGDVILRLECPVTPFQQLFGHRDIEGVRPCAGAEGDHQDTVTGLGYIQDGGETDDRRAGIGIADHGGEQPGRDLLRA